VNPSSASPSAFGYRNRTVHVRYAPFRRAFQYELFQLFLDIDRLAETDRALSLLAVNRAGLFAFHQKDHGPKDGSPLRPWAEALWQAEGVELDGGQIWLLCFPRMLGYVFNPISVWFGYAPDGALRGVIYEVRNTFGESHCYVTATPGEKHGAVKKFHVSPFMAVEGQYHFAVRAPDERFALRIENRVDGELRHLATLAGQRRPLTDAALWSVAFGMPLMTLKVTAAIHWQAFWLWLKGARYHKRPLAPETPATAAAPLGQALPSAANLR
jgi:uncharacterized protein